MLVRSFLKWYRAADVAERIEAVGSMAEAYLAGQLGGDNPADAEAALTLVLDDPAPAVRRVLSQAFALAPAAPRHIVVALAHDVSAVSGLVLARSPHLGDADLIDCARRGDRLAHLAIALRQGLSARVVETLVETAGAAELVALVNNSDADIGAEAFARMAERHPGDGGLRHALSERPDLPAPVRQALVAGLAADLLGLVSDRGWIDAGRAERLVSDTTDMATIRLAAEAADLGVFVGHLISTRQLTASLLLRSLLCGNAGLFGAALTGLTGFAPGRVAGMIKGRGGAPLLALCDRAGLPRSMFPAFAAALAARPDRRGEGESEPRLDRSIIAAVLAAAIDLDTTEMQPVIAMLRRFDAEAAREEARRLAEDLAAEPQPMLEADSDGVIDLELLEADVLAGTDPAEDVAEVSESPAAGPDGTGADEETDAVPAMTVEAFEAPAAPAEPEWSLPVRRVLHRLQPAVAQTVAAAPVVAAPAVAADPVPVAAAGGDVWREELDRLFADAFGGGAADTAPSQDGLRVVATGEERDEAFFANWTLRRDAA